jgi:hypothetical protein
MQSSPFKTLAFGLLLGSFILLGCTPKAESTSSNTSNPSNPDTGSSTPSTLEGIKAAQWGNNVGISYGPSSFTLVSDGLPNHTRPAEYAVPKNGGAGGAIPNASTAMAAPDPTRKQNYNFSIPLKPSKAVSPTPANLGAIGVMISGAVLFNPYEADNRTVATLNNFTVKNSQGQDVAFLDSCNGHPNPIGQYHYHALPTCITKVVDTANGPSHLIGVAFDGFPIYGDRALDGSKITAAQLDACNGITSPTPEFPKGLYHYVLLDSKDSTSSIRCFSGTPTITMTMPGMGKMPQNP